MVQTRCELDPLNTELGTEIQKDQDKVVEICGFLILTGTRNSSIVQERVCCTWAASYTCKIAPLLNTGGEHCRTRMTVHQSTSSPIKSAVPCN